MKVSFALKASHEAIKKFCQNVYAPQKLIGGRLDSIFLSQPANQILMSALVIFLVILAVLVLFVVRRLTVSYRPTITYNPNGQVASLPGSLPSLQQPYHPTWWLANRHLHSVWALRFRPSSPLMKKSRRELFKFEDGGTCGLDWFETPDTPSTATIVHIIHTLTGSSRDPCVNNFAAACVRRGWRAVVQNNRSCGGVEITSERLYDAIRIDDQEAVISHIRKQYNPDFLFMAGFSLGAYQVAQYCMRGEGINAVALVSHSYDGPGAAAEMEKPVQLKLYTPPITTKLVRMIKKSPFVNNPRAEQAKTMSEFDDHFTSRILGMKDHHEYYSKTSIYDQIPQFKVPTLILGAEDDPFIRKSFLPVQQVRESQTSVMVTYPEGAHVGLCTGFAGRESIVDTIVPDWFQALQGKAGR
jgi:predicted alpha/beta-fold hydrolase